VRVHPKDVRSKPCLADGPSLFFLQKRLELVAAILDDGGHVDDDDHHHSHSLLFSVDHCYSCHQSAIRHPINLRIPNFWFMLYDILVLALE